MNEINVEIIQPTLREEIASFLRSRIRWRSISYLYNVSSRISISKLYMDWIRARFSIIYIRA